MSENNELLKASDWKKKNCPKCHESRFNAKLVYCKRKSMGCQDGEHLHGTCAKCGYEENCWTEDHREENSQQALLAPEGHQPRFATANAGVSKGSVVLGDEIE